MTDIVEYDGYQGAVRYEDGLLHIRVLHIEDSISATCADAGQVQNEFQALVDDYRETCEAVGKEPSRPYKGLFNVRIEPDLHRKAAMAATSTGMNLNSWVARAISEKLSPAPAVPISIDLSRYAQAILESAHTRPVPGVKHAYSRMELVNGEVSSQFEAFIIATNAPLSRH